MSEPCDAFINEIDMAKSGSHDMPVRRNDGLLCVCVCECVRVKPGGRRTELQSRSANWKVAKCCKQNFK